MKQTNPDKALPQSERIIVEIMNGPEDGREIVCESFPISIGRSNESVVTLLCDHLVSRNHAKITKSPSGLFISDLGSTNGTFVGEKRVKTKAAIEPDMLFRIGSTLLRLRSNRANALSE